MPTEQAVEYILNWRSKVVHYSLTSTSRGTQCGLWIKDPVKITEHQALQGSYKWCKRCGVGTFNGADYTRRELDDKLTSIKPQVIQ